MQKTKANNGNVMCNTYQNYEISLEMFTSGSHSIVYSIKLAFHCLQEAAFTVRPTNISCAMDPKKKKYLDFVLVRT
jgi:hypothetical protein